MKLSDICWIVIALAGLGGCGDAGAAREKTVDASSPAALESSLGAMRKAMPADRWQEFDVAIALARMNDPSLRPLHGKTAEQVLEIKRAEDARMDAELKAMSEQTRKRQADLENAP